MRVLRVPKPTSPTRLRDGSPRTGVLKVARTIADLADQPTIGPAHIAEAIQYRPRETAG